MELKVGIDDSLTLDELKKSLEDLGYERVSIVEDQGEYTVRGGIVDIYPVGAGSAFRIEYFGDEIDGIRKFDPSSQRSIGNVEGFLVLPIGREEGTFSILSYLGEGLVIVMGLKNCVERMKAVEEEIEDSRAHRQISNGDDTNEIMADIRVFSPDEVREDLLKSPLICTSFDDSFGDFFEKSGEKVSFPATESPHYARSIDTLLDDFFRYRKKGYRVLFVSESRALRTNY